jgi:hypothetical protein
MRAKHPDSEPDLNFKKAKAERGRGAAVADLTARWSSALVFLGLHRLVLLSRGSPDFACGVGVDRCDSQTDNQVWPP